MSTDETTDPQAVPAAVGPRLDGGVRPQAWMWDEARWQQGDIRGRGWYPSIGRLHPGMPWMVRNVQALYTAEDVRYMLEGAWCAGYYHAGYTHDSAYAEKQAEKCADEFLGPNVEANRGARLAVTTPLERLVGRMWNGEEEC